MTIWLLGSNSRHWWCLFVCFKGKLLLLPDERVLICSIPGNCESPLRNLLLGGRFRDLGFDPFYRINDSWAHKVGFQVISCYPWPLGYRVPIQDTDDNVPWPNPIHPWRDGLSQGLTVIHPPGQADSFPKPDGISERKGNNWRFCVRKPIQSRSSGQDIVKVV